MWKKGWMVLNTPFFFWSHFPDSERPLIEFFQSAIDSLIRAIIIERYTPSLKIQIISSIFKTFFIIPPIISSNLHYTSTTLANIRVRFGEVKFSWLFFFLMLFLKAKKKSGKGSPNENQGDRTDDPLKIWKNPSTSWRPHLLELSVSLPSRKFY